MINPMVGGSTTNSGSVFQHDSSCCVFFFLVKILHVVVDDELGLLTNLMEYLTSN